MSVAVVIHIEVLFYIWRSWSYDSTMSLKTHLGPHHTYLATLARDLEISLVEAMDSSQGVTTL